MARSITALLQRALHDLDEHRSADERAAIYFELAGHIKSAQPLTWVMDIERRIGEWLEKEAERGDVVGDYGGDWLRGAAEDIKAGKWREG